jgi:PAS domain S-box-containing protein
VTSKPGRKWGEVRGEFVEVRELAVVLRDVVDSHGLTLRDLEERMPYGHTSISENLNGQKRPTWKFMAKFLDVCADHDHQARALLERRVRPLWDAAAPGRTTRTPAATPPTPGELVPADLIAWVTALREAALAQQTVASLQLSVSRHLGLVNGLMAMLARLNVAAKTLADERDTLREELRTSGWPGEELRRTRMLLEETQRRLEIAEQLQAETSRRLDDALRQREEAERLKHVALMQVEAARQRLTGHEQHAVPFADRAVNEQELGGPDPSLMGMADQVVAAEILQRVDDTLGEEAANLNRLQGEVAAASPEIALLSAGQRARNPDTRADNLLERYRSIVQGGPQVVWVAEPCGAMKEDAPEWRWITGQSVEEFVGDGWLDSIHREDRDRVERAWRECVRSGRTFDDRYRIRTKGGSYRHYDVRAVPIERDGRIVEWVGASTDVTSQREAEEMRGRLTEKLSAAALRTARLQQVTSMLAEALTVEEVVKVITEVGRSAIGALRSSVALQARDSVRLRVVNDDLTGVPDMAGGPLALDSPSVMTRAIETRRPVLVEDSEDLRKQFEGTLDIDPKRIAASSDERSWVGLPLLIAGVPLGALRFSFSRPRRISEEERVFLEALAGQCAQAVERAAMHESAHHAAETLQRSLLPTSLPRVPGLGLAARYLPPTKNWQIGGDWYDAFRLRDGRLAIAIGDVMGKGLVATALMGRIRSALRTLALTDPLPEKVLTGLDRLFTATEEDEQLATVAYALVDPIANVWHFSSAGHLPPLILSKNNPPQFGTADHGTPLGLACPRRQRTVDLPWETAIVLYSDGLVKDRLRPLDAGLDELTEAAAQAQRECAGDPAELLDNIIDKMLTGHDDHEDVAAIAFWDSRYVWASRL